MSRLPTNLILLCIAALLISDRVIAEDDTSTSTSSSSTTTTTTTLAPLTTASLPEPVPSSTAASVGKQEKTKYLTAEDIPKCEQVNTDLGECLIHVFEQVMPRLVNGNKELNIPATDPFALNKTTYQYTNGAVSGRITMRNAKVYGFSKLQYKSMDLKLNNGTMKVRMMSYVPQMKIVGNYKGDFTFNNVHLRPRGTFNVTLVDVNIDMKYEGVLYENDGHRFIRLTKFDVEPKIADLKIQANGIFPDPTLNDLILNMANQYWRQIYSIMLPETRQYWAPMLLDMFNDILSRVPIDAYIKDV